MGYARVYLYYSYRNVDGGGNFQARARARPGLVWSAELGCAELGLGTLGFTDKKGAYAKNENKKHS